jgi:hypothetical protein
MSQQYMHLAAWEVQDMKYSLTKYWRRHVNDTKCSLKRYQLKINGGSIEDQWQACET